MSQALTTFANRQVNAYTTLHIYSTIFANNIGVGRFRILGGGGGGGQGLEYLGGGGQGGAKFPAGT